MGISTYKQQKSTPQNALNTEELLTSHLLSSLSGQ